MQTISLKELLMLKVGEFVIKARMWKLRKEIAHWQFEKQIIIDYRRADYRREMKIDIAQAHRKADLRALERL